MPIPFCSLEIAIHICFSQVSLLSIYIPKYLANSFTSTFSSPRRKTIYFWILIILQNNRLDLPLLRLNLFDINQTEIFLLYH